MSEGGSMFDNSIHAGKQLFAHKGAWADLPDGQVRDTRRAAPVRIDRARTPIIAFLNPPSIFAMVVEIGAEKARMPWWKTLWLGVIAGIYLSFGGALAYAVGGRLPETYAENPGFQALVFGAFGLPFGLALIVICGAELWTSNVAYMPAAFYEGRANIVQVAKNWFFSFFGNLAGSLLVVWLIDETYLFDNGAASAWPKHIATVKTSAPFGQEVLRGFFCNYLVCLGVWQATGAQDIIGKIIGIFFPVTAFVALSFSHVIANMFLVPFGMKLGNPVSVGTYISRSMVPDAIGNFLSAAFFLSGTYAFMYGTLPDRVYRLFTKMTGGKFASQHDHDDYNVQEGHGGYANGHGNSNGNGNGNGNGAVNHRGNGDHGPHNHALHDGQTSDAV